MNLFRNKNYQISVLIGFILSCLLCSGEYWNFHDGIMQEAVFIAACIFLTVFFPVIICKSAKLSKAAGRMIQSATDFFNAVYNNRYAIFKNIGCLCLSILFGLVLSFLLSTFLHIENNYMMQVSVSACSLVLCSVYLLRNDLGEKPEKLFAAIALIAGMFFIVTSPTEVGICWDDNYHFDGTVSMFTVNGAYYESDAVIIDNVAEVALRHQCYDRQTRAARDQLINDLYTNRVLKTENHANLGTNTLAYIPFGIGLLIGRGLHLPYTVTFRLEKICNLVFYISLFYLAMKKVKSGKILIAAVGLLPTNLFLASNFSYDPWIISLTVLGYAWFFSYLQEPDSKLSTKDIVIMFGAFFLACIPKALYFILMFPLAFMPVSRFVSKKQRILYYISGIGIAVILASTFAWPVLSAIFQNLKAPKDTAVAVAESAADTELAQGGRGGSAADQIAFIMQDPGRYIRILFNFLVTQYINPLSSPQYAANYAYLGFGGGLYVAPLTLAVSAIFDHNGKPSKTIPVVLSTIFAILCLLVLIPTSMYIYYSTIGGPNIDGCQHRYLLPLLFPILYVNGIDKLTNKAKPCFFNTVPMLIMGLLFIANTGKILYGMY